MYYPENYDVIVIGGGHAGTEAASASARMGSKTLLLTHNIDTLGQMSCNPAIGGIGKGHLVKEIDALGGIMGKAIDHAGIQFRTLNSRKGPAVRATRAQADRSLYKEYVRKQLEQQENLFIFQQSVDDLIIRDNIVEGVVTQMGLKFHTKNVILTVGTFLGGKIHIGCSNYNGGRAGDPPANALAQKLRALPFNIKRLKTGTPPRIDSNTVNFSELDEQPGDTPIPSFSFMSNGTEHPNQISCHITYTNTNTHKIIQNNLHRSAMYSGNIEGIGPRYCPSIEDKIVRFSSKDSHQVFVEPEGLNCSELYPNGISTSLPFDAQIELVRSMKGFENAHITRPGYAIEYDFFDPRDLNYTLETKYIKSLYFAGQINGTTGYEEAAAQGILAGINASLASQEKTSWYPTRDEAYLGVLIDDLITCGTLEPYRMFTSRAEYRLILREDNADERLTPIGIKLGLVCPAREIAFLSKMDNIDTEIKRLKSLWIAPKTEKATQLEKHLKQTITREFNLYDFLKRPEAKYSIIMKIDEFGPGLKSKSQIEQIEIRAKYSGYIERQKEEIKKLKLYESRSIPNNFDYSNVHGLSNEVLQKLNDQKPQTIGSASRIPGITPAAISLLMINMKKFGMLKNN